MHGGFAEETVVREEEVYKLPQGVDYVTGAAYRSSHGTSYYALENRAALQPGEVLLVHGAAGGVGLAAVELGKFMGAKVIACVGSDAKMDIVRQYGADTVINYTDGFKEQVKDLTGGRGADVIYDPVGGDVFDESMRCIAPFGRILIVGFTSGRPALAKTNHLLVKDAELIGFTIGTLSRHDPAWAARNAELLLQWLAEDKIRPYISHTLPLEQTAAALNLIMARKVIGKAILIS